MLSPRQSIKLKIILLVLGSTCLVMALVVELMYTSSRGLIREEAESNALHLLSALANEMEQEFLLVANSAEGLASLLETGTWSEESVLEQIRRTVNHNPNVFGSCIAYLPYAFNAESKSFAPYFCKSGDQIRFVQLGTETYNYFEKDWFKIPSTERKPTWIEPYFDDGGGDVAMTTYAVPMFHLNADGERKLTAIVTADISLANLNAAVKNKRLYATGFCFVISKKGTFVTYRNPDRVMKDTIFDVAELHKYPDSRHIAQAMLDQRSGFCDIGPGFTGVDSFLAFTRMDPPGWTLGAIFPKHELFEKVDSLRRDTLLLAAAGAVLLTVASIMVARSISRPVKKIAAESAKVANGNLNVDLSDIRSIDEVGQLARSFTRMIEGLRERERIKDTFGRYLTQEVVKRLLDSKDGLKLGGEIREITIMMSDLRGFTALSSGMSPEQVIKFLNRYLGKMVEIILEHRGIIDEIMGDGILSFFGAPESFDNHPELAVACALRMQAAMDEINIENEADGLPHLEMGVGVNTGEVVVGNIGSEKRTKYGAVGAQVNFTGRVESFTVGGQVLISRQTYEKLADKLETTNIINVEMKGVPGKVDLYDVIGIKGDHQTLLKRQDESLMKLSAGIDVSIFGMDQKILDKMGKQGSITDLSLKTARLVLTGHLAQWDDVRIIMPSKSETDREPEIYGKVVKVGQLEAGMEAFVRFTSVSPDAYGIIRKLLSARPGNKES